MLLNLKLIAVVEPVRFTISSRASKFVKSEELANQHPKHGWYLTVS